MKNSNEKIINGLYLLLEKRLQEIGKAKKENVNNLNEYTQKYSDVINLMKNVEFFPKNKITKYEKKYFEIMKLK